MHIPFLVNLAKSRCLGHLCLLSQTAAISLSAHSRLLLTQKSSSSLTISSYGARDFAGHLARAEPQSRCLFRSTAFPSQRCSRAPGQPVCANLRPGVISQQSQPWLARCKALMLAPVVTCLRIPEFIFMWMLGRLRTFHSTQFGLQTDFLGCCSVADLARLLHLCLVPHLRAQ